MTIFPVYVLADRSASMAATAATSTAVEVVNQVVRELLTELSRDPVVTATVRVSVVSFADDASVDLPFTTLSSTTVSPTLRASGRTSFAAAFETTARAISADVSALAAYQDPMVFMLTDGRPNSRRDSANGWQSEYSAMLASAGPGRAVRVVPFGFGKVDTGVLRSIASDPTAAYLAAFGDSPAQAIRRFAELVFASVTSSAVRGEPRTVAPQGSRVLADEGYEDES